MTRNDEPEYEWLWMPVETRPGPIMQFDPENGQPLAFFWPDEEEPKPPREPSPGPEPGPEYQCGNCGYVSDKPGRCPRCGETI